jgi:hypothetical protein
MRISQLRPFHRSAGTEQGLKNPKVPDFSNGRRPAQDEFDDVLGQECARDVARNPVYELRWNLKDERARIAFEAVFVADSVIHVCARNYVESGRKRLACMGEAAKRRRYNVRNAVNCRCL